MTVKQRKLSIYEKAATEFNFGDITNEYRWESRTCSNGWYALGHSCHICGLQRGIKHRCICRHCGAKDNSKEEYEKHRQTEQKDTTP
jgi:hypothetical protein